jgi:Abnormal spindle-like microcephaly-assoc'd, ASPM-SPD-2-Hydin/Protein of unknown function (DUF1573)/Immunoglobulin domain
VKSTLNFRHISLVLILSFLDATVTHARITASLTSLDFGTVGVNATRGPLSVQLFNNGRRSRTISSATSSLPEFAITGPASPLTLSPGGSASIQVTFRPDAAQTFSGQLTVVTDDWRTPTMIFSLSGTGIAGATVMPTITIQPTNQTVAAGQTATFTSGASGTSPLSYQWQKNGTNIIGATSGSYTTPAALTSDNGSSFRVVVSNAAGTAMSSAAILTVNTAPAAGIRLSSTSINFGSSVVGIASSQPLSITNTGTSTLAITQISETGSAFTLSGFSLPLNIAAGQQATIKVGFLPTTVGPVSGNISIVSNAPAPPSSVTLTGTGTGSTLTLGVNPPSLNFGNVTRGTFSALQNVTITNTGNSAVTISQITVSGLGYLLSGGGGTPIALSPSQSITVSTTFNPTSTGSQTGSISIVSNASGSPAMVSLLGNGVAPVTPSWVWGVTTDDPTLNTAQQVDALKSLPRRVMIRTVFDPPQNGSPVAADYLSSVTAISAVADVMGQPIDSSEMSSMSLSTVQARITEYLNTLSNVVSVWEIGNEVNGNWLGTNVMAKVETMYDAVKAVGKPTALTLYYENPPTPGFDMIPWVDANIPVGHRMRPGLDYVLVSYYEDQNGGHQLTQTEIDGIFSALASRFPGAKLGFGEFGWGGTIPPSPGGDATRAALIQRFFNYRVPSVPSYIGGGFYWHFRQTMVPKTQPDWSVLNTLMKNFMTTSSLTSFPQLWAKGLESPKYDRSFLKAIRIRESRTFAQKFRILPLSLSLLDN